MTLMKAKKPLALLLALLAALSLLGTTALVVDRVYRLELKLARRSRRHV